MHRNVQYDMKASVWKREIINEKFVLKFFDLVLIKT